MVVLHFFRVVKQNIYKLEIIKSIAQAQHTHTHHQSGMLNRVTAMFIAVYGVVCRDGTGPPRLNTGLYL
jgi:hypothetical protein